MSRKNGLLIFLFVGVLALALVFAGCAEEPVDEPVEDVDEDVDEEVDEVDEAEPDEDLYEGELLTNSVWPEDNHQTQALNELSDRLSGATDGRVSFNVQSGGALGYTDPELIAGVRDGIVPVSAIMASGAAGEEPLLDVTTLPFLMQDYDDARLFCDIYTPYFDELLADKWNQKLLLVSPWPGAGIWTQYPIESVEDMEGLETRTYDRNGALVMEAVGGTPHPLPFAEVYSSLATGVIDSVITSTPTAVDANFWEVLDYFTPMFMTLGMELFVINLDEFNSMDAATQETLLSVAAELEDDLWEQIAEIDRQNEQITVDNGIEVVNPPQEFFDDIAEVTRNIREEWLEDAPPQAQQIVDEFNAAVGR